MVPSIRVLVVLVLLTGVRCASIGAQNLISTRAVFGRDGDLSGAVISGGVTMVASHLQTGVTQSSVANRSGLYGGAQLWSGIIDPTRAIDWSNAGVPGGIPNRTTICARLNPGTTAAQISSAIASCPGGRVVLLNAGTYNLREGIIFNTKSNVTLRGAGADRTFLVFTGGGNTCGGLHSNICVINGAPNYYAQPGNTANWTAGYAKGTTQISLDNTTNLQVGSTLILDQLTDSSDNGNIFVAAIHGIDCISCTVPGRHRPNQACTVANNCRLQVQLVTVTAIKGKNITISPGLYMPNWSATKSPGAWWSSARPVIGVGIENLSVDSSGSSAIDSITFYNATKSWVKGVRSLTPRHHHVRNWQSTHITVRDSYFYNTQDNAQESYGIDHMLDSDNLTENNIFQRIAAPMLYETCEGCIDGYNFSIYDYFGNPAHTWGSQSVFTHAPGNALILSEGNNGYGPGLDRIHGPSHFFTGFRNRWYGYETSCVPNCLQSQTLPVMVYGYSRYSQFIGNVLGFAGFHTTYQTNIDSGWNNANCKKAIYTIGYGGNCAPTDGQGGTDDMLTLTTALRWGNWDVVNNSTQFKASEVPSGLSIYANAVPQTQALPPSFYYSSKPSWWPASTPWPPIGPDVTSGNVANSGGHAYTIPAQDCYNSMGGSADGNSNVLSFNASNCYPSGER